MKHKTFLCSFIVLLIATLVWAIYVGDETEITGSEKKKSIIFGETTYSLIIQNFNGSGENVATSYTEPPKRIIAVWQNSVETLLSLGMADHIIGAAGIDNPAHLTQKNQILYETLPFKTNRTMSQETAVTLHPDLIVGWRFDFTGKANSIGTWNYWHARGVNVYMTNMDGADFLKQHTVEDELQFIWDLGRIVGKSDKAKEIINSIQTQLAAAEAYGKKQNQKPKVVVVFYMDRELHVYTPRTLPGDLVNRLGGEMLGKSSERIGEDEVMSYEELRMADPDVLFIQSAPETDKEKLEAVYSNPQFQDLQCVKNKRVYTIPFYTIRCPSVRVADAIQIIRDGLYPE